MVPSESLRMHRLLATLLLAAALLASGCAGTALLPPPPTLDEIVKMSKEGVAPEEIVRRLQASRAVYALSGSKLAALHEAGVPDLVLDYLQQSYIDAVRYREWMRANDWYWWGPPYWLTPYRGYPWRPPPGPPPR